MFARKFRQIRLLFWKYLHVCYHRPFLTLFQILLPIIIIAGWYKYNLHAFLSDKPPQPIQFHRGAPEDAKLLLQNTLENFLDYAIIYSPKTNFSSELLNLAVQNRLNNTVHASTFNGTDDPLQLVSQDKHLIGLLFHNLSNDVPQSLSYTLASRMTPKTRDLFEPFHLNSDDEDVSPYKRTIFTNIQLAIDSSYIDMVQSQDNKKEVFQSDVAFQSFGYNVNDENSIVRSWIVKTLPLIIIVATLTQVFIFIDIIITEKKSGVMELMAIYGVHEWLIWVIWGLSFIIIDVVICTIVVLLLKNMPGVAAPAFQSIDFSLLWVLFVLYLIANIICCFTFCAAFREAKETYAGFVFFLVLLMVSVTSFLTTNKMTAVLCCLFPSGALIQGFRRLSTYEMFSVPLNWSGIHLSEMNSTELPVRFVLSALVIDAIIYSVLTFVMNEIHLNAFRRARSFVSFYLRRKIPKSSTGSPSASVNTPENSNNEFYERVLTKKDVSVRLMNVTKRNYQYVNKVHNMNLNIYKNEIFVLLGHNGSGKSTVISMLAGLQKPSSGSIMYEGGEKIREFRKKVGYCAEEDRLFPYLTCMNHLIFYGMLKGATAMQAQTEATEYLKMLHLKDDEDRKIDDLTAGNKRKLCFAIALMGVAPILILDEPTSGLDVHARINVWDFILGLRGKRTIILATHQIKEADLLADRIAILNQGSVVCYGSPLFLKKIYDAGHHINVITASQEETTALTIQALEILPAAQIIRQSNTDIIFRVPISHTKELPKLLILLEDSKDNLGVKYLSVSYTSFEDVFFKTSQMSATMLEDFKIPETGFKARERKSYLLLMQQISVLGLKKILHVFRSPEIFIYRIIMPTLVSAFLLWICVDLRNPKLLLSLGTYPHSTVMLSKGLPNDSLSNFRNYLNEYQYKIIEIDEDKKLADEATEYGKKNMMSFSRDLLLGIESNKANQVIISYNALASHSLPIAINMYTNVILRQFNNGTKHNTIIFNQPVARSNHNFYVQTSDYKLTKFIWWLTLVILSLNLADYCSILVQDELFTGFKHIQIMAKVSPVTYWISNLMFDFVRFMVIIMLVTLFLIPFDRLELIHDESLQMFFYVCIIYVPAILLYMYVIISLFKTKRGSHLFTSMINILSGLIVKAFYDVNLGESQSGVGTSLSVLFKGIIGLIPPLNISMILLKLVETWDSKKTPVEEDGMISYVKYEPEDTPNGILTETIFLLIDIFLYAVLLIAIETRSFSKLFDRAAFFATPKTKMSNNLDAIIDEEEKLLENSIEAASTGRKDPNNVLVVHKLQKRFVNWLTGKSMTAVQNVTFGVEKGKCFGLVGINSSGMSTTLRLLAGDVRPTSGNVLIDGLRLKENRKEYLSRTGYCPDRNSLIEELTGAEMLQLVTLLRGIHIKDCKQVINDWLSILDLKAYANEKCSTYSNGNKRKLCLAMSLIGDPAVVFLDEPTSQMDLNSRHKLHAVFRQNLLSGQVIVLSTHDMEECERLCDRLTVLCKGHMTCLGTIAELKEKFTQGFVVQLKVYDEDASERAPLKMDMERIFGKHGRLTSEHTDRLTYHIDDHPLKWSQSFEVMEIVKANHVILEDYLISDTSLERIIVLMTERYKNKV